MRLHAVQALLDEAFQGIASGAPRMFEPDEPRFHARMSAVWLEYRWYVQPRGVAEVFVKWQRVEAAACAGQEVSVLRVHLLGHTERLEPCARRLLVAGTPSPGRLLALLGEDGVRRECATAGATGITLEQWPAGAPQALLPEPVFTALRSRLLDAAASSEERHEAVDRLCRERSARVVHTLLEALDVAPSLSALRRLSEWGETAAVPHVERALAGLAPDNPGDRWTLTALRRRFQAWQHASQGI